LVGILCEKLENKGDICDYKTVQRKKLFPFENHRKLKFIKIYFRTNESLRKTKYTLRKPIYVPSLTKITFEVFETNIQSVLRFSHVRNIRMTGWISVENPQYIDDGEISRAQISASTTWDHVSSYECDDIAPFLLLSYDLECYSSRGYPKFPEADIKGDFISQIGCSWWVFGGARRQVVFTCVPSDPVEGVTIVNCKTEKEMLRKFCLSVESNDPDIITGYNIWGFDDTYLWRRIEILGLIDYADRLSRIIGRPPQLVPKTMSSGAYGHNEFKIITMFGRESFDVCFATRREYKLESFKLDKVAEHFLDDNKVSIPIRLGLDTPDTPIAKRTNPYQLLFEIIARKDPKEVAIICEYCAHDALLPNMLIEKLCYVPNFIEMAKSTRVPIDWLLLRGQQCKVFSQIAYEARLNDYAVPVFEHSEPQPGETEEKYKGATVLHANTGAYFEPVAGLDFKSLYPSIMIAYNMCYTTLVQDPKYLDIPGVEYETVKWYEEDKDKHYSFTFVQNHKGLLPGILERLWEERNQTKVEMKKHKGTFKEKVLNGKQLAIKVTMNSAYGFCGASRGMLPCKAIAASVTAKGREMIARTSKMAQELYNCVTTYGDSVTPETPILIRDREGLTDILPISELASEWQPYPGFKVDRSGRSHKQQSILSGMEVWDGRQWTRVRRVIRHIVDKPIFRVRTNTGYVEVTEDHSLITENGTYARPRDVQVGSRLETGYPLVETTTTRDIGWVFEGRPQRNCDIQEFIYGYFFGISEIYDTRWKKLRAYREHMDQVVEHFGLSQPDNLSYLDYFLSEPPRVPGKYLRDGRWFLAGCGYAGSYGCIMDGELVFLHRGQLGAAGLYYLGRRLYGSVAIRENGDSFEVRMGGRGGEKSGTVRSVRSIQRREVDYVYDIETESGHFLAGVGDTVVKNTDSCYVKFIVSRELFKTEEEYLEEHFRLAQECADAITASFKKPIELEFEKVMYPFFLYKKKRYAYLEWVRGKGNAIVCEGISSKGIELVRRDFCEYVKDTGEEILNALMYGRDMERAKELARVGVRNLLEDKVPIKKLVISKSLNDQYKVDGRTVGWDDPDVKHPHVQLAQRIKKVDPMNHPKPPDRVPYVFMMNADRNALQYEKVEHPDYVTESQVVDVLYYFNHQLKNCVDNILEVVIDNPEDIYAKDVKKRLQKDEAWYAKKAGFQDIRNFFGKKI
jgi:DNA polymerase elongation subunit (family B)